MLTFVITGGPCSGKTSALEMLKARFAEHGIDAMFVAEAGTDLILSGISPESCGSMLPFQMNVAALQVEREDAAREKAAACGSALVVCDRGICDGAAYVGERGYELVLDSVGLSAEEALARYDAVFCLESTAKLGDGTYTQTNNSARSESADEAALLDDRTAAAWKSHPRFHLIANEDTFDEKAAHLADAIMAELSGDVRR